MPRTLTTESDLNALLSAAAARAGRFWQRFEDALQLGLPDAYLGAGDAPWLALPPSGVWVELKITRAAEPPAYRPGQLAFAARAGARGERCATLAWGTGDRRWRIWQTSDGARARALGNPWPAATWSGAGSDPASLARVVDALGRLPPPRPL